MRLKLARPPLLQSIVAAAMSAFAAQPASAQTTVTSIAALRSELAIADRITVVMTAGPPVSGRLIRFGDAELEIVADERTQQRGTPRQITVGLDAIRSIERRRDSTRNGTALGAAVGAGIGGAMFVQALIIDRNEIDEWAGAYAGLAAISTGIGALVGWALDAGRSKPEVRYDAPQREGARLRVQPLFRRDAIALAVSFTP
jgi:hypothetical protein